MGTKNDPAPFDCYANAEDDEPMFVLLARDRTAPDVLFAWIAHRVREGLNEPNDPQIVEAAQCAHAMRRWRLEHRAAATPTEEAPERESPPVPGGRAGRSLGTSSDRSRTTDATTPTEGETDG